MVNIHFEPFLYLAGLTHDDALIAWGGFYFRDPDSDEDDWTIIEDPELTEYVDDIDEGRERGSIGVASKPYGHAVVEVIDLETDEVTARAETSDRNHVWVRGLEPDTEYRYRITVDGEPWAEGPRRDWMHDHGLDERDLEGTELVYDTRFRTFPAPDEPASCRFAVIGDYGIGILASGGHGDRQRRLAAALERAVDHAGVRFILTTGDNIYLGEDDTVSGTGNYDDDWYFSYYEPYRYAISRVPVFPGVGNHDTSDSEVSDNRDELADNLFTQIRFKEEAETGRFSVDPGLYYQFDYGADLEFTAIDTTMASDLDTKYFFEHPEHREWLENAFPPEEEQREHPKWRIPFSHHPPFNAGPKHDNAQHLIDGIVPLLQRAGVKVMLSGHEHNFQHQRHEGIDYIVTGAGGKLREGRPEQWDEAHLVSWKDEGHFLIVDVDGDELTIHPVTDVDDDGNFTYLEPVREDGSPEEMPIRVSR
ncbi:MAG: metallophosphoesterase [Nitriliruptorales bacterium]|nr:metallophosphoesterase [Nitriliruptorales bacterium]